MTEFPSKPDVGTYIGAALLTLAVICIVPLVVFGSFAALAAMLSPIGLLITVLVLLLAVFLDE